MYKAIYFDMDGTIANLYGVDNWLEKLEAKSAEPYALAVPLVRMQALARRLNNLQRNGYKLGIISWTSKTATEEYAKEIEIAKRQWLKKHLPSVEFNEIIIVPYGTKKSSVVRHPSGVLFDDEQRNRIDWGLKGFAFAEDNIFNILENLK